MNMSMIRHNRRQRLLGAIALICGLALAMPAYAQKRKKAPAPKKPEPTSMLWKVHSDGNFIYELGSVHVLGPESYPLAPAIESAISDAEAFTFETNLDSMLNSADAVMGEMFMRGMFTGDTTLSMVLPKGLYDSTAGRLKTAGMDIRLFESARPWVTAMILMGLELQEGELEAGLGIEAYVGERAAETAKPIASLESAQFQIGLFAGLSLDAQITFLRQSLAEGGEGTGELDAMIDAWERGDAEGLASILTKEMATDGEFYRKAITERNLNWMPYIEEKLKGRERHMIVVGAGHLVGEGGVIRMLERKGYRVEQL